LRRIGRAVCQPELMPGAREHRSEPSAAPNDGAAARRSVVPRAAGRSLWRAATWTGAGAAVVCATVGILAVAVCWLPVSGSGGRAHSAIHAGLLTFLAALHGGVTIDGTSTSFLPLGMLAAVAITAWRAGAGLADAAVGIGESDPLRLALAGLAQAVSFTGCCLVAVPYASLGTSDAPFLGVAVASFLLFALSGGTALVLYSPLSDALAERIPASVRAGARAAGVVLCVYLAAGALLVVGSAVVHHARIEALSAQVGGGWGGVPVLLLGVLAAPNAAIAGAAYLAGPGFAVGGSSASAFATAHGVLPAFPLLGAMPDGAGAGVPVWVLMALTPLSAGLLLARLAWRQDHWAARWQLVGTATAGVLLASFVLGWQAGGAIGAGGLSTIGPSPWQLALAVSAAVVVVASAGVGVAAARSRLAGPARGLGAPRRTEAAGRLQSLTDPQVFADLQLIQDSVRSRTGRDVDTDVDAYDDAGADDAEDADDADDAASGSERAG
jgi:hypothetical protein